MKFSNVLRSATVLLVLIFAATASCFAIVNPSGDYPSFVQTQQYDRAVHIMAMLILGFGFLMVFVKKYGRSALTATFLLVSVAIPVYYVISDSLLLHGSKGEIERLILSEFGAASLLIAAGALLGRLKMHQYIVLGLIFIPFYILNEWIILGNGLGFIGTGFVDTGGSIIIHAFGAFFGVAATIAMRQKSFLDNAIEVDATSDRYSMLGSMVLWLFWPSFCAALVPEQMIPFTVVNVFLALCGSTLITYIMSVVIRGKINIADIANASLAGGVAIGSTCNTANHLSAFIIGLVAGAISTFGFAILMERQQKFFKAVDTCGVTNLHGLPGIFGGLAALPIVANLNIGGQLMGIGVTVILSVIAGLLTGKVLSLLGNKKIIYVDAEEFLEAE